MTLGVIDQNATHRLSSNSEEMAPALELHVLIDQTQESFVDKPGGCEGMTWAFASHVAPGEAAELIVDQRHQGCHRLTVAAAPVKEQLCNILPIHLRNSHLEKALRSPVSSLRYGPHP